MSVVINIKTKNSNLFVKENDEEILVIRKERIFPYGSPDGIHSVEIKDYEQLLLSEGKFMWRSLVEEDSNYKQIIPYLVFGYDNKYFLMQRRSSASEVRLKNKYSLGIGGHIKREDLKGKNIFNWADREFFEEVDYKGNYTIDALGILNDESDSVGVVHTGFVFLVQGDSSKIKIRSELKSGSLVSLDECLYFYPKMEKWSQYVFDFLKKRTKQLNPTV